MAFLIGGANTLSDAEYDIDNSCRFNDGDSAYMDRTIETPTFFIPIATRSFVHISTNINIKPT